MKSIPYIAILTLALGALCDTLSAGAGHDHGNDHTKEAAEQAGHDQDHAKKKAGPNGGRLITGVSPHAEFFVTADRFTQITFVDAHGEATAPAEQFVSLIGGNRSNPIKLTFAPVDGVLRSSEALPEQPNMPIILSIKSTPDAKTVREKFYLNQSACGGCDYEEYACTCGH